jgi:hypothetical protein
VTALDPLADVAELIALWLRPSGDAHQSLRRIARANAAVDR